MMPTDTQTNTPVIQARKAAKRWRNPSTGGCSGGWFVVSREVLRRFGLASFCLP